MIMNKGNEGLSFKQAQEVVNKLGGMGGVKRFLSGELMVVPVKRNWKSWKTIKCDARLESVENFQGLYENSRCFLTKSVIKVFRRLSFDTQTKEVDLVKVSVEDLGFDGKVSRRDIYRRAEELGLRLCLDGDGPRLRLQYLDQPYSEKFVIAMKPVVDAAEHLYLFGLERNDEGLWLVSHTGNSESFWMPDDEFVFRK